jgi:hypothetical protein
MRGGNTSGASPASALAEGAPEAALVADTGAAAAVVVAPLPAKVPVVPALDTVVPLGPSRGPRLPHAATSPQTATKIEVAHAPPPHAPRRLPIIQAPA